MLFARVCRYHTLDPEAQQAALKARVKDYCQRVYKHVKDTKEKEREVREMGVVRVRGGGGV